MSGIVRSGILSSSGDASGTAEGVPMTLQLTISDLAAGGTPYAGVAVYVWHCTRAAGRRRGTAPDRLFFTPVDNCFSGHLGC